LFLKNELKLPINREKGGIRKPVEFKILGHEFVPTYKKGDKGKYQVVVSDRKWKSLKLDLKQITRKTAPLTFTQRITQLKTVHRGWINYFRMVPMYREKKPERKRKNLIRLGITNGQAYAWSRTRMGGWAVAQSPILGTTITLKRLIKRGYVIGFPVLFT
jgi:RNA-directed DNA polymerase